MLFLFSKGLLSLVCWNRIVEARPNCFQRDILCLIFTMAIFHDIGVYCVWCHCNWDHPALYIENDAASMTNTVAKGVDKIIVGSRCSFLHNTWQLLTVIEGSLCYTRYRSHTIQLLGIASNCTCSCKVVLCFRRIITYHTIFF